MPAEILDHITQYCSNADRQNVKATSRALYRSICYTKPIECMVVHASELRQFANTDRVSPQLYKQLVFLGNESADLRILLEIIRMKAQKLELLNIRMQERQLIDDTLFLKTINRVVNLKRLEIFSVSFAQRGRLINMIDSYEAVNNSKSFTPLLNLHTLILFKCNFINIEPLLGLIPQNNLTSLFFWNVNVTVKYDMNAFLGQQINILDCTIDPYNLKQSVGPIDLHRHGQLNFLKTSDLNCLKNLPTTIRTIVLTCEITNDIVLKILRLKNLIELRHYNLPLASNIGLLENLNKLTTIGVWNDYYSFHQFMGANLQNVKKLYVLCNRLHTPINQHFVQWSNTAIQHASVLGRCCESFLITILMCLKSLEYLYLEVEPHNEDRCQRPTEFLQNHLPNKFADNVYVYYAANHNSSLNQFSSSTITIQNLLELAFKFRHVIVTTTAFPNVIATIEPRST